MGAAADDLVILVACDGEFAMEVRGESNYQDAIRECVGAADLEQTADDACHCEFRVRMAREPDNPHDVNAVAVTSASGRTLGYLAREIAQDYAPELDQLAPVAAVWCPARAYGRREYPTDPWRFGVWLDLPDASDFAAELLRQVGAEPDGSPPGRSSADSMVAVNCPACGSPQQAAKGVGGFRCKSCQNDVWIISCHRCHTACPIFGSAVGAGAIEFRCGNCRAKNVIAKQALRSITAEARRVERAEAAARRELTARQRELKVQHVEDRQREAEDKNHELQARLSALGSVLATTLDRHAALGFDSLKTRSARPTFSPSWLAQAEDPPQLSSFLPTAPSGLAALVPGARKKHAQKVEAANAAFEQATEEHSWREAKRLAELKRAKEEFDAKLAELEAATRRQHEDVDELERRFKEGDPDAVAEYLVAALATIRLPYEAQSQTRLAFSPQSHQLVIELELPDPTIVPEAREYRYVKARDELRPIALPAAERKRIYGSLVAQVGLSVLHEAFRADPHDVLETIVLNGHVHTVDKRTGQEIHPCLLTVRATREHFADLNLAFVDAAECLKGLSASISRSPAELVPVRPMIEFDMADPRFVIEENILSSLDTRPNLMELSPKEFESLITNLFEKMGLETRLTQPSRDGGVDCVAYDSRPIFGGKVVIQAKRYKNTVGVSAVRDLFGTMQNEGATKGILVTTSGYGQASHEFANGKPLELIDGGNLLYLLQTHASIEAKIEVPDDWVDPEPDS